METEVILGISFFRGSESELVQWCRKGGLVVAPSGPGLAGDLVRDPAYCSAVLTADFVLPDSGLMVLVWNGLAFREPARRIRRISGLKFLSMLLADPDVQEEGASFWIMPSVAERDRNLAWLHENGFGRLKTEDCYVAPDYRGGIHRNQSGDLEDEALAVAIEQRAPRWVFLNVGSGVQEPLGHWLRGRLSCRPTIVCTGAAIAFFTGGQAFIPPWADRLFLGWLFRIMRNPGLFLPRYAKAFALLPLMLRWQHRLPEDCRLQRGIN